MSTSADRNMLFGILALQMDFIDRDQLVTAMNAWVLNKSQPLDQVLTDQGALDEDARTLLAALVQKHIAMHDGDPEKSLAAVSSIGSVRGQLQSLGDPDVEASLHHVSASRSADDPESTLSMGQSTSLGERFRILRPHAKGGLGMVSLARDNELDREVALKEIQDRYADDTSSRERFTHEAMITGGLEHPGIVPVYGLGQYDNGRPYYAMRFIRGDSLKEAITRFHKEDQAGRDAGQRRLELRKLLGRFVDVCHALEYAHSRGVLHRDLKPGNIMLGKYGETLVVDWGLAKTVERNADAAHSEEPTLRPRSGGDSAPTQMGSVVGTPGFLSPEQAAGRLDLVGPATDVFGLGATLYCLLTGKAPFPASEEGDTLKRAQEGRFPPPVELNSKVPKALNAICLKAMALKQEDRYASCLALADEIEHYLADEPVEAYREPIHARAGRFVRHHQVGFATSAAALVVAFIGASLLAAVTSASNATIRDKNERITAQNVALEKTNRELELARDEAERKSAEAEAVTEYLVGVFDSPNPNRDTRSVTVVEVLDRAFSRVDKVLANKPLVQARVLCVLGETYHGLRLYAQSISAREQARDIQQQQLGTEHPLTLKTLHRLAETYSQAGQPQKAQSLFEEVLPLMKQRPDKYASEVVYTMTSLGRTHLVLNEVDRAILIYEDAVLFGKENLGPEAPPTLSSLDGLAAAYRAAGRLEEAIPLWEDTLRIRRDQQPDDPLMLFGLSGLANAYRETGRSDEEILLREEGLQRGQVRFGSDHPKTLTAMQDLALAYRNVGRTDDAIRLLRSALEIGMKAFPSDHSIIHRSRQLLAWTYSQADRLDEAKPLFEEALRRNRETFGVDHPDTLESMNSLAWTYRRDAQLDKAVTLHEEVLRIRKENLSPCHPDTLTAMDNLAMTYRLNHQDDKAMLLYEDLIRLQEEEHGLDHQDTQTWMDKVASYYLVMRRNAKAEELCSELLEIERRREPGDAEKLTERLDTLAFSVLEQRHPADAESLLRESLEIRQNDLKQQDWRLANTQSMLGAALIGVGKPSDAEFLLLEAHKALTDSTEEIPKYFTRDLVTLSLSRLVELYKALDRPNEEAKWQAELDKRNAVAEGAATDEVPTEDAAVEDDPTHDAAIEDTGSNTDE